MNLQRIQIKHVHVGITADLQTTAPRQTEMMRWHRAKLFDGILDGNHPKLAHVADKEIADGNIVLNILVVYCQRSLGDGRARVGFPKEKRILDDSVDQGLLVKEHRLRQHTCGGGNVGRGLQYVQEYVKGMLTALAA